METSAEITFASIMSWDRDTSRKNFANPTLRPLIDEVIRRHNEAVTTGVEESNKSIAESQSSRVAQEIADGEKAQAERLVLQAEVTRQANLTPDERVAEYAAEKLKKLDGEREEGRARVAREREAARWASLRPEQQRAEIEAQAEAERVAEEKAQADRIAAEQADAAKVAADKEAADKIASDKLVAEKDLEEKVRLAAEAAKVTSGKKKFVRDYQVKDETGNPIGRRTHLEADTPEEMFEKMEKAHVEAVKYAERMKKRSEATPTVARTQEAIPVLTEAQLQEIQKNLDSKNEIEQAKAKAALELNDIRKNQVESRAKAEYEESQRQSKLFIEAHPEFYTCQANADMIRDFLVTKGWAWTAGNLEIAYANLETNLAQKPGVNTPDAVSDAEVAAAVAEAQAEEARVQAIQAAEEKVRQDAEVAKKLAQEQAAQSAAAAASVAPTTPVAVTIPVETSPVPPNAPIVERKLPAGGLEPGALHGARPTSSSTKAPGLTKQDIGRMSREEYGKRMKDPNFVKLVNALFAPKL